MRAQALISIPQSGSEPVNHRRKIRPGLSRPIMPIAKAKMRQGSHAINTGCHRIFAKETIDPMMAQ
ncbi:hypothetical protein TH5_10255 [Thalassospira xianhensis MCCC 1A02616]|uniref:Uncharacterized protein n=1 Tax=Thalassospira xianhensis MCCC 1A02616 TaxID=1177929 RepID=A0A367UG51_9PROT|nr:hypothetical protein TH5_10255 [Thalassospira xianhensis MCCC 1A02616]